jgi:ABC-type transport system involved in multi-copper enzyme maturation permease subunit
MYPLIFSKPVGRASYLLGKFFGNFFVLVCCQSTFAITLFLLQWVPFSGMVTLPVRVIPYFKHFFIAVVISHLVLAAVYFAAGTLTRNAKVVYLLAACFYPVFIGYQFLLRELPTVFRVLLDPIGFNSDSRIDPWSQSADFLNQYVVRYSMSAYTNRASMIIISSLLLLIVYLRFRIDAQESKTEHFTKFAPSEPWDRTTYSAPSCVSFDVPGEASPAPDRITIPEVTSRQGPIATLSKLIAAVGIEFRLFRAERGFIVLVPLAIFLSFLSVPFSRIAPDISYSVTSATNTANMLLLFLAGVIVFYTGETMHLEREVKLEPVVWSTPAPNTVLLISKFLVMTLLAMALVIVGSLTTIVTQLLRGYTPVDFMAYLIINLIVVVPAIIFMAAFGVVLNVLLRNKYLAYVVAIGTGAGLFYLYNIGYNHWVYNPLLYRLWKYDDLAGRTILTSRLYCLALAAVSLVLAHLFFERKSK